MGERIWIDREEVQRVITELPKMLSPEAHFGFNYEDDRTAARSWRLLHALYLPSRAFLSWIRMRSKSLCSAKEDGIASSARWRNRVPITPDREHESDRRQNGYGHESPDEIRNCILVPS